MSWVFPSHDNNRAVTYSELERALNAAVNAAVIPLQNTVSNLSKQVETFIVNNASKSDFNQLEKKIDTLTETIETKHYHKEAIDNKFQIQAMENESKFKEILNQLREISDIKSESISWSERIWTRSGIAISLILSLFIVLVNIIQLFKK